jgi:branched-chain amino acid aminotransferase
MQPFPEDMFVEAVKRVVADNAEYVPPFGTGGSLYIRPLLFGSGARIGLNPSDEYTLLIMVIPVGDYYKGGLSPVTALVIDDFDRAAPRGVGNVKVREGGPCIVLSCALAEGRWLLRVARWRATTRPIFCPTCWARRRATPSVST